MASTNEGASVDLNDLLAQQAELTEKIEALKREARTQAIAEVRKQIALYALEPTELGFAKLRKPAQERGKVRPKYRDPATGATWAGRGHAPTWIAGKEFSDFLIS